jgi:hypothetical protein
LSWKGFGGRPRPPCTAPAPAARNEGTPGSSNGGFGWCFGPTPGDFPPVTDTSEGAWAAALDNLDRQHRRLLDVIAGLDPARLDETVPGKDYPAAVMLHGTAQHYAYHAGQIALLKKLVA